MSSASEGTDELALRGRNALGRSLTVDPVGLVLPPECACCGAAASRSLVERRADGESVIVPYCGECCAHATNPRTRQLAIGVASGVVGVTLALALPLAFARLPLGVHLTLAVGAALLPLAIRGSRTRAAPGHSSAGRAVWWLPDGRLHGTRAPFMAELARLERTRAESGGSAPTERASAPSAGLLVETSVPSRLQGASPWLLLGPAAAAALAPLASWFFYPLVRVVNLSDRSLVLSLDGSDLGSVEPTTVESPTAGRDLHLPAGRHRLLASQRNGEVVSDLPVIIEAGRQHLYAPGDHAFCFWLETTSYGRSADRAAPDRPLAGRGFWVLPAHVDSWFAPNPTGGPRATSGGTLTALRQGPCTTTSPVEPP